MLQNEGEAMKITFTSHKKEIQSQLNDALDRAMMTVGMMGESEAKRNLTKNKSVDTGLLRNSITYARGGKPANISGYSADRGEGSGSYSGSAPSDSKDQCTVYIGTNVEYAPYVELGTSRSVEKPYLRPAATSVGAKMKGIIQAELQKG